MRFDRGMLMRGVLVVISVAGLAFLAACGGSSNMNNFTGVAIRLVPSTRSVSAGGVATVTATVSKGGLTWSLTPASFGALSNPTATGVTYAAPATVSAATVVTITATSTTSTGVSAPVQLAVQPLPTIALQTSGKTTGPQTIGVGQQLSVNAVLVGDTANQGVTWSLSAAVGTLSNATPTAVTYIAPGSVGGNTPVTLTATSKANTGSTSALELTVFPAGATPGAAANVAALTTDNGLTQPSTNSFYASVTICAPGTTNCQTIDNILVDTGSEGLRVLQSAMTSVVLPQIGDGRGDYFNNCVSFVDGSYLWGPVAAADIYIGGEVASSSVSGVQIGVPIQLISSGNPTVPSACLQVGATQNDNTPGLLGANGILGIGLEPTDCYLQGTDLCDGIHTASIVPAYFLCPSSGCFATDAPTTIPASQQVLNPVVGFNADNNGTQITFPSLPINTVSTPVANGSLVFGIPANSTASAVLFVDSQDFFPTVFNSQTLASSFIDSGSNGMFFPSSITACTSNTAKGFYCPSAQQGLSATNHDPSGVNPPSTVSFKIDNADTLFTTSDSAFSTLGGPGGAGSFDFGAPFFYGRTIFTGIDQQVNSGGFISGNPPFVAY